MQEKRRFLLVHRDPIAVSHFEANKVHAVSHPWQGCRRITALCLFSSSRDLSRHLHLRIYPYIYQEYLPGPRLFGCQPLLLISLLPSSQHQPHNTCPFIIYGRAFSGARLFPFYLLHLYCPTRSTSTFLLPSPWQRTVFASLAAASNITRVRWSFMRPLLTRLSYSSAGSRFFSVSCSSTTTLLLWIGICDSLGPRLTLNIVEACLLSILINAFDCLLLQPLIDTSWSHAQHSGLN